ncbi:tRNA (adenosine(37)-N6)-threonylcarbamoyltransferase complex dimerization subunit type 1 TsaB [Pontitalea aquivivens]|uniref:tRNA (adenosine(37)-N6)-threonylcarbamoyltransferase complex dimerization subunit type 1 TsaB n=1 Tax=Pontitalea aquivivens TaxID=3388663 RepID=UPI003970761B
MPAEPLILGFDTSAAHCAAALLAGDRVVAARQEEMAKGQAERLMPMMEQMLADAGIGWRGLAALGVGIGPGNFTGVRIAVAAARGLALSLGIPAVGVSTLEARALGQPRPIAVTEDARRDMVYWQHFTDDGASPPALAALADLPAVLQGQAVTGTAAAIAAAHLRGAHVLGPVMPLAEAIARIALLRRGLPGARPAPLYLRGADAAPPSDPPPVILG